MTSKKEMRINRTPAGTTDLLYERCEIKREVEASLFTVYKSRGFAEVVTPALEYYDVFTACDNPITEESMFKLTDSSGRLVVMRPDCTMPIARLAASRLKSAGLPLRLCYNQNVYRNQDDYEGRKTEVTQSGAELIGAQGLRADVDIIMTALAALDSVVPGDYKLELGHTGVFRALADEIPFRDNDYERVRACIDGKNYAALNDILERYNNDNPEACEAVRRLPRLFGGGEVFAEARKFIANRDAADEMEYLQKLYQRLKTLGCADSVLIDLGLVHHINYYSGLVFGGYMEGAGRNILSGGRYDGLIGYYGRDIPAAGFAVDVDAVCELIDRREPGRKPAVPELLIHYVQGCGKQAYIFAAKKAQEGVTCEMSLYDTETESRAYAKNKGMAGMAVISDEIRLERYR